MSDELATPEALADDIIAQARAAVAELDSTALTAQLMRTWREGFSDGMEMAARMVDALAASGLDVETLTVLAGLAQTIRQAERSAPRVRLGEASPHPVVGDDS